ncbi:MAG: cyclic nucleotide-binding domain-containing protein [Myxococcales bacterium]|nr:cyclic nucleotide-binding domain-containing protein [Myxococcales bacterium]
MSDSPTVRAGSFRDSSETLNNLWNGVAEVVTGSFLFRSLDEGARRELVERGVVMVFAAGKAILREGAPGHDFFLVDRGVVEVLTRAPDGQSVPLATLQRGAFFGEVAMLTGMPRTASVIALTEVSAVRFDKPDIDAVLDKNPQARRLLEAMIKGRARDTAEKVVKALSQAPGAPDDTP